MLRFLLLCHSLLDLFFFSNEPRPRYPNPSSIVGLIGELGKLLSLGTHFSVYKMVVIIVTLPKVCYTDK